MGRLREQGIIAGLTTPFIYAQAIPLLLLDISVTLYQWLCFPVYGIPRVVRKPYFAFDRYRLGYLNPVQKLNCTYCTYANGVIAYTREVTARTEAYWCPIRHSRRMRDPHRLYGAFSEFGDARAFRMQQRPRARSSSTT
jgi:hypothetical protein